jgi:hypothetical protein
LKRTGKIFQVWVCFALFVCWGCQNQNGIPMEALDSAVSKTIELPEQTWEKVNRNVTAAEVDGDSLRISISYGGGCGKHRFNLVPSGPPMKSLPPKYPLTILHESTGDPCRAMIFKDFAFDLSPFRLSPHGTTVILLDSLTFTYSYD